MSLKSMPLWKWALLLLAGLVLSILAYGLAQGAYGAIAPAWGKCLAAVIIPAAVICAYAQSVKWFEKHPARDLPLTRLAPDTAKGLCIGFAFFVVVVLLMYAFGAYRIGSFGTDKPYGIFEAFLMFLMVAVCEEIIFRGILFRWIDEKWGFAAALAVSSLFFGLVHISQPGATLWSSIAIAIEAGLLLGAAYKYAGSLWLPIGIHWAWNFTEGNIFGFSVSGGDGGASLITPVLSGSDLLTGGIFGAEASLIAPILGVMLSVWFIILSLPGLKSRI